MNIGIDIDGTINDGEELHEYITDYFELDKVRGRRPYSYLDAYSIPAKEWEHFYKYEIYKGLKKEKPRKDAVNMINNWYNNEHQISIITARNTQHIRTTKEWLKKYKIPYHNIYFSDKKSHICLLKGINIMIEDSYQNALECALHGIRTFLINTPYNEGDLIEGVSRFDEWEELAEVI